MTTKRRFLFMCVLALGGLIGLANACESVECSSQWFDREHRYGFFSGCMVKTSHGWMPARSIREVSP